MIRLAIVILVLLALIALAVTGRLGGEKDPLFRFLLYLDIFACALVLGDADMTISARCGLALRANYPDEAWLRGIGRVLNMVSRNHCERAIADDVQRARSAIATLLDGK